MTKKKPIPLKKRMGPSYKCKRGKKNYDSLFIGLIVAIVFLVGMFFGMKSAEATTWTDTKNIIENTPALEGVPIMWTNPTAVVLQTPEGDFALGAYDRYSKMIFVAPGNYFRTQYVLLHETGHWVFYRMPIRTQNLYCQLWEQEQLSPSRYGEISCLENFAEMFAVTHGSRHRMYSGLEYILKSDQARIARESK